MAEEEEMESEQAKQLEKLDQIFENGLEVAVIITMPTPHLKDRNSSFMAHTHTHGRSGSQDSSGSGSRSSFDSHPLSHSQSSSKARATDLIASTSLGLPPVFEITELGNAPPTGVQEYALGLTQVRLDKPL